MEIPGLLCDLQYICITSYRNQKSAYPHTLHCEKIGFGYNTIIPSVSRKYGIRLGQENEVLDCRCFIEQTSLFV